MKVEVKRVRIEYDEHKEAVIKDVSFTINPGDFIVIRGPSGGGKSSLLRVINQLQQQTAGEILVDDQPITELNVPAVRRQIAYIQQTSVVFPGSVLLNFQLAFRFRAACGNKCPNDAELRRRLDEFSLSDVNLTTDATTLSVGQKQRLCLIRTLLLKPKIVLCDEPTSALDVDSRKFVERWLVRLNRDQNISVVLVTHLPFESCRDTRNYVLKDGLLQEVAS